MDSKQEKLTKNLRKLTEMLEAASENGLFNKKEQEYKSIIKDCCEADSYEKFYSTYNRFNEAINASSFRWRFIYAYGGAITLYYLIILLSIFISWFLFSNEILNSKILWVPSWAFIWGSLGGILQGFWCLWQHVSNRCLRKNWFIWFFVLPLMGAILGALVYLIYLTGFIVSTGGTQLTSEFFAMLLSAIAGFSSWWAVELLNTLSEIIQIKATTEESDKS